MVIFSTNLYSSNGCISEEFLRIGSLASCLVQEKCTIKALPHLIKPKMLQKTSASLTMLKAFGHVDHNKLQTILRDEKAPVS